MFGSSKRILAGIVATVLLTNAASLARAGDATFQGLGSPEGGWSMAENVSADGSTVVGGIWHESGLQEAFRWTAKTGMLLLGTSKEGDSRAMSVSADGSAVVGYAWAPNEYSRAVLWTAKTGMVDLGSLGKAGSYANGISADGATVVGESRDLPWGSRAFRWTAGTGMVGLGWPDENNPWSTAWDVSADGSIVVGTSSSQACLWTAVGTIFGLGTLGGHNSEAYGISADGSTVTGSTANVSGQYQAFRWTAGDGMVALPPIDGMSGSYAWRSSADGSTITGSARDQTRDYAVVWDALGQGRLLEDVLTDDYGLDLAGWTLEWCSGISADGRVITGVGTNPAGQWEAWIAVLGSDEPTVEAQLEALIQYVYQLNLKKGIENSLDTKLQSVLDSLQAANAGDRQDAGNKLLAFIQAVEAQRDKAISHAEADALRQMAEAILDRL